MKELALLAALAAASLAHGASYQPDVARMNATAQLKSEPKIKDVYWPTAGRVKVGVLDDGTRRDRYAMYICEILRERRLGGQNINIRVIDIAKLARQNKEVVLGEYTCS